ncbi:MAG: Holliday junction resolvase RuvX [Clostridia bacterium]|nr:Holliday junction resolvase RuvX [Clostridia bacterium]
MVIMSVDLGLKRTGIAVSDKGEGFAFPKGVIVEHNEERLAEKVAAAARENGAELIVVGLPKNMDGSLGFRAEECTTTAEKIKEISGIPTEMWDERCTTVLAHNALNATNTRGKKRKETVDAVAAVLILESYLDFRKNSK